MSLQVYPGLLGVVDVILLRNYKGGKNRLARARSSQCPMVTLEFLKVDMSLTQPSTIMIRAFDDMHHEV